MASLASDVHLSWPGCWEAAHLQLFSAKAEAVRGFLLAARPRFKPDLHCVPSGPCDNKVLGVGRNACATSLRKVVGIT